MITVTQKLILQSFLQTVQQFNDLSDKLDRHNSTEWAKLKAELEEGVRFYDMEAQRLEALLDPLVLAHLKAGAPPNIALQLAEAGTPVQEQPAEEPRILVN